MTDLRTLHPTTAIWRVSWPVIVLGWLRAMVLVVDSWWVGQLGSPELVALASVAFGWWIVEQLMDLAGTGTHARVAQAVGGGRQHEVGRLLVEGLLVGGLTAAGLGLLAGPLAWGYAWAIGVDEPGWRLATGLLGTLAWFSAGIMLQTVVGAVFRGLGDTRTVLWTSALALLVTAVLDPLLMWGWGPLPALGLNGVAVATAAGSAVGAAIGLVVLHRRGIHPWGRPARGAASELLRIGGPYTISGVGFSLVYVLIGRQITAFGPEYIAAIGIGHRIEAFFYLVTVGMMAGCTTLVGQHVGAGDPEGAMRVMRAADRTTSAVMLAGTLLVALGADLMVGLVTPDPAIRAACATYLRFQCVIWVMMGWEMIYEGAFAGAAWTMPAMLIGTTGALARVPVAWWLSQTGLGVTGIWLAVAASTFSKGVAMRGWWYRRTWVAAAPR